MSTFKEDMFDDVDKTFLEIDEFAETHNVDGKEMLCVLDESEAERRATRSSNEVDGVYKKQKLLFVPRKEFDSVPTAGTRVFKLDGKRHIVKNVAEEGDMYAITLEVYAAKGSKV